MMPRFRRSFPALVAAVAVAALAPAAHAQLPSGVDYVSSPNVEHVMHLKQAGDGVGAKVVGNTLFVTSTTHISIFDVKNAESPVMLGALNLDVEWENEEVPTNGKLLGVSASSGCKDPVAAVTAADTGCLNLYDVTDPAAIRFIKSVPGAGDHVSGCALDCTYFYGSSGTITDARDPANAQIVGNWIDVLSESAEFGSCHATREMAPGMIIGSCQPVVFFSILPEHGGSPTKPALIATATNEDGRFIHSARWPNNARDKFLLIGGETNASGTCDDTVAAFMSWDTGAVVNQAGGWNKGGAFTLVDEIRPTNGTYADGHSPYNGLGCSVHWFSEHPTFYNGGLVALAEYENGTRLIQVTPEGKLIEQGYFLPLAGSTSAPHWHPNGKVIYAIDYLRGVDVLRYTGETYSPGAPPDPGATPGTGGEKPGSDDAAPCASAAGFREVGASPTARGVAFRVTRREARPFTVDIFQQSAGSRVVKERLVARFTNRTRDFVWNGNDGKGRRLPSGNYFARFTMKLSSGLRDVRRVTLARSGSRFRNAPDFYQRVDCGIFRSLKLSSSVFGGRTSARLGLAYKLEAGAAGVEIVVKAGSRTVRTLRGGGARGRTYRYSFPAGIARRGQTVTVTVTADRGGPPSPGVTLTAKRI